MSVLAEAQHSKHLLLLRGVMARVQAASATADHHDHIFGLGRQIDPAVGADALLILQLLKMLRCEPIGGQAGALP